MWWINRVAFHPAGWRLIYYHDTDGTPVGFTVERIGPPIAYPPEVDERMGARFVHMLGTPSEGDT